MIRSTTLLFLLIPALFAASPAPAAEGCALAGALALGDFNNDGHLDLAIGSPGSVVSGHDEAGVVHVLYGAGGGLRYNGQQVWHLDLPSVDGDAYPGSMFGQALAVGDFNCDTVDDLAIGEKDAVTVFFGVDGGKLTEVGAQRLTAAVGSRFGSALAAGQFGNVSGCGEDLAIGQPDGAGKVRVFFGDSSTGLDLASEVTIDQDSAGVPGAAEPEDRFGSALAAGNFDDDAFDDLAIGVPGEEVAGIFSTDDEGAVNVLYGDTGGFDLDRSQIFHQDSSHVEGKTENTDRFGASLAVGDLDNNGYDDLIVGVPEEDDNNSPFLTGDIEFQTGAINVLRGSSTGLLADEDQPGKLWWQDSDGIEGQTEQYDRFGEALAAADFDGDGHDDVAAGVPGEDREGTAEDAGVVNVIRGAANGLTEAGDQLVHQNTSPEWVAGAVQVDGDLQDGDRFGCRVVGGPLNNDPYDDLVVTVLDGPDVAINVVLGSPAGLTGVDNEHWTCEGLDGCSDFAELLNPPSGYAPVTDGVYTDPNEWSDVEPLAFTIGDAAPTAADPEDGTAVDAAFFTALGPEPDPQVAHLNLHADLLLRTDTDVSAGEEIAVIRFPVLFGRASSHQLLGVHLIGGGPGAPAMPPNAWLDKDGDGQPDDTNGDGAPDVPASSVGIEASAGFAASAFQATPHLQVELKVPLSIPPGFPDPNGPLGSVPDGPGGIYTPEPALWTVDYLSDQPGVGRRTAATALVEVLPDGAFQDSARLTAERALDIRITNDLGDGDGQLLLAVLSVPDTPDRRLFDVKLFNGADPGRFLVPVYDYPEDVDNDGEMDQVMQFDSADVLDRDMITLHARDVLLTARDENDSLAGSVAGLTMPEAGAVPDGGAQTLGSPLTIKKSGGGGLKLFWSDSCSLDDTDYAVYEGRLGEPGSHSMVHCTTGGATTILVTPGPDDHYYLVVPLHPDGVEGSYGVTGGGQQRPQGIPPPDDPLATTTCATRVFGQACE